MQFGLINGSRFFDLTGFQIHGGVHCEPSNGHFAMMRSLRSTSFFALCAFILVAATSCNTLYFASMEKLGYAKRDLMVGRIKDANQSQEAAKKQFANALEEFRSVVKFSGGDLEAKYKKLDSVLKETETKAADVKNRVTRIEDVADALFSEWKKELKEYQSDELRRRSEEKLRASKERYETMIEAMRKSVARLDPALRPLQDNVLFLKHNLNAAAIGALAGEQAAIEANIDELVRNLDRSIAEGHAFVETIKS